MPSRKPSLTPTSGPTGSRSTRAKKSTLSDVAELLAEAGYDRVDQVEERGQFAVRGGILDVFGATEERAVRVELFGDEIESLRWFSTFTQRSLGESDRVELAPAAELASEHRDLAALAGAPGEEEDGDERLEIAELLPVERFQAPLGLLPDEAFVAIASVDEIPAALHDHWEDVTAAMHADDARHLYVDVADQLDERASLFCERHRVRAEALAEGAARRVPLADARRGRGRAREAPALRLQGRRRLRAGRRGGPRPLQPRPHRGAAAARGRPASRPGRPVRRGEPARGLRVSRAEARRHPMDAPRPPQRRDRRPGAGPPPHRRGDRAAGRRPRRARGSRRRPLLGLRHQDARRCHPRLPGARVQGRRQGLRPDRPAREDQPLRRRRRRRPAAERTRGQALAQHEGPRPARGAGDGGRAAQPLRRAPGPQRPRLCARRRDADRFRGSSSPTARPPTSSTPSTRPRPTWRASAPWTA